MSQKNQKVEGLVVVVAAFPEEESGEQALKVLKEAQELKYIHFEDAAVIRQDADGSVHYHETGDMSTGKGATVGALIGGVLGILGGPGGIVLGAGAGAAIGGVAAHGDASFSDKNLKQLGVTLKPSTSALILSVSDKSLHKVRDQVSDTVVHTAVSNLSAQLVAKLEEGKNVALGITFTEDGLSIIEVATTNKLTELISIVAAKDGVIGDSSKPKEIESYFIPESVDATGITDAGTSATQGNLPS